VTLLAVSDSTLSLSSLTFNIKWKIGCYFCLDVNNTINRSANESSILIGRISKHESKNQEAKIVF